MYDSNKTGIENAISDCCKKYNIGCDIDVKFNEDLEKPKNDVPKEGYGRVGASLNNYNTHSGKSGDGNLDVLLTKADLDEGNAVGLAAAGRGLIMNPRSPGFTMPHEIGHCAGYNCGDQDDKKHNSNEDHIMAQTGGKEVDECYCKKISGLAK